MFSIIEAGYQGDGINGYDCQERANYVAVRNGLECLRCHFFSVRSKENYVLPLTVRLSNVC